MSYIRTMCCFTLGLPLLAQAPPGPGDAYFWDGDRLIRRPFSERNAYVSTRSAPVEKLCATSPDQVLPKSVRVSGLGDSNFFWKDGAFHTVLFHREEPEPGQRILVHTLHRSEDGLHWEPGASLRQGPRAPALFHLRPVTRRLWVASSGLGTFALRQHSSGLGLFQMGPDGTYELRELLERGVKNPRANLSALSLLAVPEGWIYFHKPSGFLWCVLATPEGGVRTRLVKLFDSVTARLEQSKPFDPVILCAQATREGTVLLATRTEEAVLQGPEVYDALALEQAKAPTPLPPLLTKALEGKRDPAVPPPHPADAPKQVARDQNWEEVFREEEKAFEGSPEGRAKQAAQDAVVRKFPEVIWWSFDPATGKLRKVDVPGAQTLLKDHQDLGRFWFRFQPDGRLVMGRPSQEAQRP